MINIITRMRELSTILHKASHAYYIEDRELMTDREYDALYDELVQLEHESGIILTGSPTQKVGSETAGNTQKTAFEAVTSLKKVPHAIPMLSLDKTKEVEALAAFLSRGESDTGESGLTSDSTDMASGTAGLLTWKLDGLAISLTYENGALVQALTRGNGSVGEDVTHNARVFTNVPLTVPDNHRFAVRGEAVISYKDFTAINASLPAEESYKNPRNLCSGTVRQLNSEVAAGRKVRFYAIETIGEAPGNLKSAQLNRLAEMGFEVVPHTLVNADTVAAAVEAFKTEIASAEIATDGLVLTFDDIAYSKSLGATSKFPRGSLAFKWADEMQETTLTHIEWNTSRTGLINPVAVFEPVELEGTSVTRASVHNVSILRELALTPGDRIRVYKANMIIPQVAENLSRKNKPNNVSAANGIDGIKAVNNIDDTPYEADAVNAFNTLGTPGKPDDVNTLNTIGEGNIVTIPTHCPVCNSPTEIIAGPSGEALYCAGTNCAAQRIRALAHFASRNAMNIDGLSEQTLEKLVALGIVEDFTDLFRLHAHEDVILNIEGFGRKSYDNLIAAIETAKNIALPNFIYALGIRHVGLANAKLLCAHFNHDAEALIAACACACRAIQATQLLCEIKGFGEAIATALHRYFADSENRMRVLETLPLLNLTKPPAHPTDETKNTAPLANLTFVITGDVTRYKNRKELQNFIESQGGKVTGSVTAKTSYLINNNAASTSGKNKKAAELGVPVLTETGFEELLRARATVEQF